MDQGPQPEELDANIAREERRTDVQRRIDEVAGRARRDPARHVAREAPR
jgi:hypothetical protein